MFSFIKRSIKQIHRNFQRRDVHQFLTVYDEDKFVMLGRVIDISTGGMCVVSELSIPLGNIVKLIIEVLDKNGDTETFWVRVQSVWQKPEKRYDLNKIGFKFIGLSPSQYKKIQEIICQSQY